MKRLIAFAPLAVLGVLIVAAAFVLLRGGERETVSAGQLDRPAPTFALTRLGGGDLVTSDAFAGRVHVVNFFASWCTPCRAEHPQLMALRERGIVVLGIAYKDEPENSARFLNELGDPFEAVALDPDGRFALEMGVAGAVPETFVIDARGRIRAVHRGPLTADVVAQQILPALEAS
jgi:cytochrome c biogenesis protein CcmG, thiol:disulfide interchange protein DsbE